jgi:2-keto-3-deoxy-L-rhamnonate aldolase RhmA
VNGVDGVFVGPNDLSCDLHCIGDNGPVKAALKTVSAAVQKHDKPWGIITASRDLIGCSLECGVNFISYGSEINMLKDSCKKLRGNVYG